MNKEKWAAIVKYTSGETTGAVVTAENQVEAWKKLMSAFGCENIAAVELAMVLTDERGRL